MDDFVRDHAMYAVIFGFFAFSWFGWSQESPPEKWRKWLGIASGVGLLIALWGGLLALQNWHEATALAGDATYQKFGIIVGIEFLLASVGAALLAWRHKVEYTAAWIAMVVGAHFIPLAVIFKDAWLYVLAALLVIAVPAALYFWRTVSKTTAACIATGSIVMVFAVRGLLLALF